MPALLAGLTLVAVASGALAGAQPVPFFATVAITETVQFVFAAPCFAIGSLTGQGFATGVGYITGSSQDCINPIGTYNPNAPSFQFASTGPGLVFNVGNGEKVFASYSGTLTYRANRPNAVAGHFVITGGSGRFDGATGGGTVSGFEDISRVVSATGVVFFKGSILFGCQAVNNRCSTAADD